MHSGRGVETERLARGKAGQQRWERRARGGGACTRGPDPQTPSALGATQCHFPTNLKRARPQTGRGGLSDSSANVPGLVCTGDWSVSWQLSAKAPSETEAGREGGRQGGRGGERGDERGGTGGEREGTTSGPYDLEAGGPAGSSTHPAVLPRRSVPLWRRHTAMFRDHSLGSPGPCQRAGGRAGAALPRPGGCTLLRPPGTPGAAHAPTEPSSPTAARLQG